MRNNAISSLLLLAVFVLSAIDSVLAQSRVSIIDTFERKSQVVTGDWQKRDGELTVGAGSASRAVLATEAPEDYSLTIEFTREEGDNSIGVILPVGESQCAFIMSAFNGEAHGIGVVDGNLARDNFTTIKPGVLETGHPYRLQIEVDVDGDSASISSALDGRPFLKWSGNPKSLAMLERWKLRSPSCVGLCTYAKTTFHSAALTRLDSTMRMTGVVPRSRAGESDTAKKISFEGHDWVAPQAESVTVAEYNGKQALHIKGKEPNFAFLPDYDFGNGTIDVDIASSTFSGIGFLGNQDGSVVEKIYLRPFNSGTDKHANTVQHSMLGNPELGWRALRKKSPGEHEAGADIKTDQWFHLRLVVNDGTFATYIDQNEAAVLSGKLFSELKSGRIGVWGWDSYFANFRFSHAD